ncbi:TlpA family protein disulfide reductase [Novosphingobium sp. B 225]|uniref:TlpA family protein disulfide reductase n=1 Tax=Novosphingobium sp. B 225 TaxID=1961849 RepID=UPI0020CD65D0|nr:TlpA disulfide reductase family protein [Novosphingobium sp. B 225]
MTVLVAGCDRQSGDAAQPQAAPGGDAGAGLLDASHKGSELPDFTFKDASGKELRLASLKGKPLLINLWATWCGPCVAELPTLQKLAQDRKGQLQVQIVSQDMGEGGAVADFLKARTITALPAWLDPDNQLASHYKAETLPTTIYYGADGRERWRWIGGRDWGSADTAVLLNQ